MITSFFNHSSGMTHTLTHMCSEGVCVHTLLIGVHVPPSLFSWTNHLPGRIYIIEHYRVLLYSRSLRVFQCSECTKYQVHLWTWYLVPGTSGPPNSSIKVQKTQKDLARQTNDKIHHPPNNSIIQSCYPLHKSIVVFLKKIFFKVLPVLEDDAFSSLTRSSIHLTIHKSA